MPQYVKVAKLAELPKGKCLAVEVDSQKIVLVHTALGIFALEDSCTHLGAPLSQGFVSSDSITCEWHGASFNLKTGAALNAPAKDPVTVYELRISGEDIEILV